MTLGALLVAELAAGANISLLLFFPSAPLLSTLSIGKSCERRRARGVATSCISGAALSLESVDSGPIVQSCVRLYCSVKKDYTLGLLPLFLMMWMK